jgi:uncharacterized protein (DUF1330 family)
MPAYVLANIKITDRDAYAEYAATAGPAVARYGGRYLALVDQVEVLEGEWEPDRLVIIGFDSVEQARVWWTSPEYETAKALRRKAATSSFVLVEGR